MSEAKFTSGLTGFGAPIDALARTKGGWPDDVVVYAIEVVNDQQLLMSGGVPDGARKDGRPKWPKKMREYRVVVADGEYRAALSRARSSQ